MAKIKPHIRRRIYVRDGYKCLKCKCTDIRKLTIDHIVPLFVGGKNIVSNMQTLCNKCNNEKGTDTIDYRTSLYLGENPIKAKVSPRIPRGKKEKKQRSAMLMNDVSNLDKRGLEIVGMKIPQGNPGDSLRIDFYTVRKSRKYKVISIDEATDAFNSAEQRKI